MGLGNIGKYIDENHYGNLIEIGGEFFSPPEMKIEDEKTLPKVAKKLRWNWKRSFSQELMAGRHKLDILKRYEASINKFNIAKEAESFLEKNDGIIGYTVVDAGSFDEKFGYKNIPANMKKFNLFVVGARDIKKSSVVNKKNTNDGTMDGFLASTDTVSKTIVAIDENTGLYAIENIDEIDENHSAFDCAAKKLLEGNLISLSEHKKFAGIKNKFAFVNDKIKESFTYQKSAKSFVDKTFEEFGLAKQKLVGNSDKAIKEINVSAKSQKLGDIGEIKKVKTASIDEAEFFNACSDKNEIKLEEKPQSIKISNKYEFGW